MLNKTVMMGRLVKAPELRRTQNGTAVASFTLAVERDTASRAGTKETDFIDHVAFGATAEFAERNLEKGSMVTVAGRLQIRSWEDKNGSKRRTAEVVAESIYFAGGRGESAAHESPKPTNNAAVESAFSDGGFTELTEPDENLPF